MRYIMRKRLGIAVVLLLTVLRSVGIEVPWPDRNLWPESPQTRAVREAMMPSAGLLTGAVDFTVPLYTIEAEGFSLPVTLRYHSNGIRPGDDPQPVGWGWVLTPPLRVSRQINGRPDECSAYVGDKGQNFITENYDNGFWALSTYGYPKVDSRMTDPEPDWFTVYLPDATLRLLYIDGKFRGQNCGEYRVEGGEGLDWIKVTAPSGTMYEFSEKGEMIEWRMMNTEWLLSRIILPSGTEISIGWNSSLHKEKGLTAIDESPLRYFPGDYANDVVSLGGTKDIRYVNFRDLESVTFPGGVLRCVYTSGGMLSAVTVSNGTREVYRADMLRESGSNDFLSGVRTSDSGTYHFGYDPVTFGSYTGGIDWWGFYNGQDQKTTAPRIELTGMDQGSSVYDADRRVNSSRITANILRKVTYPGGGSAEWDYEVHRFAKQSPPVWVDGYLRNRVSLTEGGGVRVSSVTLRESDDDPSPRVRRYVYGEDGDGLANIEAAPFLHTFFSETGVLCYRPDAGMNLVLSCDRLLTPSRQSDFLSYQPGVVPVWYGKVTELEEEGKTVHEFRNLCPGNEIRREWGRLHPENIRTLFSGGPRQVCRRVYRSAGNGYKEVEREEWDYEVTEDDEFKEIECLDVWRELTLPVSVNGITEYVPDFGPGKVLPAEIGRSEVDTRPFNRGAGEDGGDSEIHSTFFNRDDFIWYGAEEYHITPLTERLTGRKVTRWHDNGITAVTEKYEYLPGTGLVTRTVRSNGTDSTVTCVDYNHADAVIAAEMAARNVRNIPYEVTERYRTSVTGYRLGLMQSGTAFRPRSIHLLRDGHSWSNVLMEYDSRGRLTGKTTADGIQTYWRYDSIGNPVETGIRGSSLVSKAEWEPLLGVSTLASPSGTSSTYTYGENGLLSTASLNGRVLESYLYDFDSGQGISISTYSHRSVFPEIKTESTVCYDGLGRKKIEQTQTPEGEYVSVLTEYDIMGRPSLIWSPAVTGKTVTADGIRSSAKSAYGDGHPYSLAAYESSPRVLPLASTKAGDLWHEAGKEATSRILTNDSGEFSCPLYRMDGDAVERDGVHPPGSLSVEEAVDEDGVRLVTYRDFRGNTVCRDQGGLKTSYIYDDSGLLRVIIPPGNDGSLKSSDVRSKCYSYSYDSRGRLIYRKFPQASASEYIYDDADRKTAVHSSDHAYNAWRLYGYDFAGREVLAIDVTATSASVRQFADSCRTAILDGGPYGGYSLEGVPSGGKVVYARYFDSHDFISLCSLPDDFRYKEPSVRYKYNTRGSSVGLQTGLYTGEGYEAYHHNTDGRLMQSYATGFNRGRTTIFYNYDGSEMERRNEYGDSLLKDFVTTTEYNSVGQPVKIKMSPLKRESSLLPLSDGIIDVNQPAIGIIQPDTASVIMGYNRLGQLEDVRMGKNRVVYGYDVHGWPVRMEYSSIISSYSHTEVLRYADGTVPRYNGNISVRESDGQRHDYTYDIHNRLISADCSDRSRDVSTRYEYDDRSNITTLVRRGIVDRAGTTEIWGTLDSLQADYSVNQMTCVRSYSGALPFSGITGIGTTREYTEIYYDSSGRLYQDETRGISDIFYDNNGNRSQVITVDGTVDYTYDGVGNLCRMEIREQGKPVVVREYTGQGHVIEDGKVVRTACPGGYFPCNGGSPLYYLTDYQGNNIATLRESGVPLETHRYYPYGEPWREPQQEDYLYSSNERIRHLGLNEYNFHARHYRAALPAFDKQDSRNEKYPWLSPYVYCGGNPVNMTDKYGQEWKDNKDEAIKDLSNIKVFIFYSLDFKTQAMVQYDEAVKKFGENAVALSKTFSTEEFKKDWSNMSGDEIASVLIMTHGKNQSIKLADGEYKQFTATGDGYANISGDMAPNIQDLPTPEGNISGATLYLYTCHSADDIPYAHGDEDHHQGSLKGECKPLAYIFAKYFNFKSVIGTKGSVSYHSVWNFTFPWSDKYLKPRPDDGKWIRFYRK